MWNSLVATTWSQCSMLKKEKLDSYFWEKQHPSQNNNNESKCKNNPVLWRHLTEPRLGNASPKHQEMDVTAPHIEPWQDVPAFRVCVVFSPCLTGWSVRWNPPGPGEQGEQGLWWPVWFQPPLPLPFPTPSLLGNKTSKQETYFLCAMQNRHL